jgi:hypothetical protein
MLSKYTLWNGQYNYILGYKYHAEYDQCVDVDKLIEPVVKNTHAVVTHKYGHHGTTMEVMVDSTVDTTMGIMWGINRI